MENTDARPAREALTPRSQRTRMRIMHAAERLLGSEGLNGPSMRQIAMAAQQSNASVIHYHFTDKDNLIAEILLTRVMEMEPLRETMLLAAQAADGLDDLKTLLRIVCMPHLELKDSDGRYPFAKFLLEFMQRYRGPGDPSHPYDVSPLQVPHLTRTLSLIRQRLHYMDAATMSRRSIAALVLFLHSLVRASEQGAAPQEFAMIVQDSIEMGVQALTAPLPPLQHPG